MAISTVNIGSAPNDGTGDPLRTAFQKTNTNFLNITADGGDEITVVDPTTATDAPLNDALANIYASGVATPNLQQVTDEGNETTNNVKFVIDADNYIEVDTTNNSIRIYKDGEQVSNFYDYNLLLSDNDALNPKSLDLSPDKIVGISNGTYFLIESGIIQLQTVDGDTQIYPDKITVNSVDYPLPTGVSSQIATLADVTGVTDGDKGDITVSGSGTVWTIDNGLNASKIADGSVSNTEFQYLDGVTSNIQNQINSKQDKTTVFKNTTQTAVTSTTSETIIYAEEVLANTLSGNTILSFKSRFSRGPRVGTCALKLYLNTVNNLSGSPVAIAQVTINANIGAQPFVREQIFIKDNVLSVAASSNAVTDVTSGAPIFTISTYDINTTYYWILTAQPNTSTDSLIHNFSILEKK